jgi:hypothetical protein
MQAFEREGDTSRALSRRELLKRAGVVGVAAAAPAGMLASEASSVRERDALETLTAAEAEAVEAIVDRLIPSDANGPGAAEARVARYIDRALGGELSSLRATYSAGLAAVDAYAEERFGAPIADLPSTQRDAVLTAMEENVATGFPGGSRSFPVHGGNEDFVGWDLIGFPGVKLGFSAAEQQLDVVVAPAHKSTADYPLFKRARKRGNGEH